MNAEIAVKQRKPVAQGLLRKPVPVPGNSVFAQKTSANPTHGGAVRDTCPSLAFGLEFSRIPSQHIAGETVRAASACPLTLSTPRTCPFGGACHTCPARLQAELAINQRGAPIMSEAASLGTPGLARQHWVDPRLRAGTARQRRVPQRVDLDFSRPSPLNQSPRRHMGSAPALPAPPLGCAMNEHDPTQAAGVAPNPRFLYQNGTTTCTFPAGTPSTAINNSECSRPCTVRHEGIHSGDIAPCCSRAGAAHAAAATAADKQAVENSFFGWMSGNRAWFECRAYAESVRCADELIAARRCSSSPASADAACCATLTAYRADKEARRTSNCAAAGGALSACPF